MLGSQSNLIRVYRILLRLLRVLIYLMGAFTITFYFFNFIGIIIGISFILLHKNNIWKQHGIVLAFATSISAVLAQVGGTVEPIFMAMVSGWGILTGYFLFFLLWRLWLSKIELSKEWYFKFQQLTDELPRWSKGAVIIITVSLPLILWASVNIHLGVMFDNKPRLLWIHAPSTVDADTEFNITVEAWDAFERLSALYGGTVEFSIESYNLTTLTSLSSIGMDLPGQYTFTGQNFASDMAYSINDNKDNGLHVFQARITTPGYHYILVTDSYTLNTYYSNPILVRTTNDTDLNIYWSDLHSHSFLSDGSGSSGHSFYYARYVACLDVYALTDHGEILIFDTNGLNSLEKATNRAYDPYHFVTLHGIEWTQASTGHYTCIFNTDFLIKDPIISFYSIPNPDALWEVLDDYTEKTGCQALALPHHTTKRVYSQDWAYFNPKYVKIAEVTSVHGDSLFSPANPLNYRGMTYPTIVSGVSIIDALKMGHQLSLYGSSDNHDGHPGHSLVHTPAYIGHQRPWTTWYTRNDKHYPSGLTAIFSHNLTRKNIFTALDNRLIYANSDHGRPLVDFKINGTGVGNDSTLIVNDINDAREIQVFFAQDGAPAATENSAATVTPNWIPDWNAVIEIIKNGALLAQIPVTDPVTSISYIDNEPITGTSYGEDNCIMRGDSYYLNKYSDKPVEPDQLNTNGVDFYLIRIVGNNGRTSYIGPIWVKV